MMTAMIMRVISADASPAHAAPADDAKALPMILKPSACMRVRPAAGAVAKDRLQPFFDVVCTAQQMGNTYLSADNREDREDHKRYGHDLRRFVDMVFYLFRCPAFAVEGIEEHAEHVECGHTGGDSAEKPDTRCCPPLRLKAIQRISSLLKNPEKPGTPAMARQAIRTGPVGDRYLLPKTAHLSHVELAAHGVHDAAGPEKEETLEEGVGHEVKDACRVRAYTDTDKHVSELAHRRIGQDPLYVVLGTADGGGEKSGKKPDEGDNKHGHRGQDVEEVESRDHVDAGGDHGGGVDQGTDRCRAFHGVGQPDIKRYLGRFSRGADKEKKRDDRGKGTDR